MPWWCLCGEREEKFNLRDAAMRLSLQSESTEAAPLSGCSARDMEMSTTMAMGFALSDGKHLRAAKWQY